MPLSEDEINALWQDFEARQRAKLANQPQTFIQIRTLLLATACVLALILAITILIAAKMFL